MRIAASDVQILKWHCLEFEFVSSHFVFGDIASYCLGPPCVADTGEAFELVVIPVLEQCEVQP